MISCTFSNREQAGAHAVKYHTVADTSGTVDGKHAVCFVYHRFGNDKYPSTNVTMAQFKSHLNHLKEERFDVMTLSEALRYVKSDGPERRVAVISVDDGFKTFYENAFPLLQQYKFPATLFINTETVGGSSYMNWDEVREVHDAGIEIGNHTHTHDFFLNIPEEDRYDQFQSDVEKAQDIIREQLGMAPSLFAYPYGEFDPGMCEVVRQLGFEYAAAQNSGVIYAGSDAFALPRFPMATAYAHEERFAEKAAMRAMPVHREEPRHFILETPDTPPRLTLQFPVEHIRADQLQCFVQGGDCRILSRKIEHGMMTLTVQAKDKLKARRTLYTITVPGDVGNWYWYSHLWINPDVR